MKVKWRPDRTPSRSYLALVSLGGLVAPDGGPDREEWRIGTARKCW
jgi:hypothetical protein